MTNEVVATNEVIVTDEIVKRHLGWMELLKIVSKTYLEDLTDLNDYEYMKGVLG